MVSPSSDSVSQWLLVGHVRLSYSCKTKEQNVPGMLKNGLNLLVCALQENCGDIIAGLVPDLETATGTEGRTGKVLGSDLWPQVALSIPD